jgi:hypothetical protein
MEADDESDASGGTRLQKITAVYNGSYCHGTPRDLMRQLRLKLA